MEKRMAAFLAASLLVLVVNLAVQSWLFPPKKVALRDKDRLEAKADREHANADKDIAGKDKDVADKNNAEKGKPDEAADAAKTAKNSDASLAEKQVPEKPVDEAPRAAPDEKPEAKIEPQWISLGSANAADPYRMLVTLTNMGAAIERAELNNDRYSDLEDRAGYLGFLATTDAPKAAGSLVRIVGRGTPAAEAGLKPGDVVWAIDGQKVLSAADMETKLEVTTPGQIIELALADGRKLSPKLGRRPVQILRPEHDTHPLDVVTDAHDPFSMLFTLERVGDKRLEDDAPSDAELRRSRAARRRWEVEAADETEAVFLKRLPSMGLEVRKRYRLAKVDPLLGSDQPAYHLDIDLELRNTAKADKQIAYRFDGPTGVVLEGAWYGSKINRYWFEPVGLRDVVGKFKHGKPGQVAPATIAKKESTAWPTSPVQYVSVDAQYFTTALIPAPELESGFLEVRPILAGDVPKEKDNYKLTDVTFRMTSQPIVLEAGAHGGETFVHPVSRPPSASAFGSLWTARSAAGRTHLLRLVRLGGRADADAAARLLSARA